MKRLLGLFFLMLPLGLFGQQNLTTYTASNGVTYNIGDTIKLGRGSATNGDFLYLQIGGWAAVAGYDQRKGTDQNNIGRGYSGLAVTLKKIKQYKMKGQEKVYFIVGGGNITNYNLMIEDAIAACEVADCKDKKNAETKTPDKYDKLKKLKELLDQGALTQEEYDKEKKKILEEN